MKRIVAALLASVLALESGITGICSERTLRMAEKAQSENMEEGDFQFEELPNKTLKITKYTGRGTRAEIPSEIGGKEVVMIDGTAFSGCADLTAIMIPASVTNIGGKPAAYPEHAAFSDCGNLAEIIVEEGNETYSSADGVLFNKEMTELISCPAGKAGNLAIPEGITDIKERAFYGCGALTGIIIPASLTSIAGASTGNAALRERNGAFCECESLEEITADGANEVYASQDGILYNKGMDILICCPAGKKGILRIADGVRRIGNVAFWNCAGLTSITIPESVSRVAEFKNCGSLTEIVVDENNETYASDNGMLYTKDMTELLRCPSGKNGSVAVPDGVTAVNENAFDDCNGLISISLSKSVVSYKNPDEPEIYSATFNTCDNLKEISVDKSNQAYVSLNGILYSKDMTMLECCPPGQEGIIDIPDGVESIQNYAFLNCKELTGVTIPGSVKKISSWSHENVFRSCESLDSITVDSQNQTYYSIAGMLFVNGETEESSGLLACPPGKADSVTVPEEGSYIYESAFENCKRLTSIKLPEGLEMLNSYTFENCVNLSGIELPKSLRRINYDAFRNCARLGDITMPEQMQYIDEEAFTGCGDGLRFICAEGSLAETYAKKNGISYQTVPKEKKTQSITAMDFTKTVGDMPFLIKAVSDGDGDLVYKSDNESVAIISEEGIIVIKGAGKARITITASETDVYKEAQKVITVTVNPKAEENVTPSKKTFTVTFDANGGTGLSEARRKRNEGDAIGTLPSAKRSGYILIGWYTQKSGGVAITGNTKVMSNMTVYARWREEKTNGTGNQQENTDSSAQMIRKTRSVKAQIKSVRNVKNKKLKLKLGGLSGCDGYQVQYGLDKNFKGAKNVNKKSGSVTIAKLKRKKTYYVRARVYKIIDGETYHGKWSGKKKIKIKK